MKEFPLPNVYQLIEPGPVVLLTTVHKGHANVMTMSWHMMVEFDPPQIACIVSNANHSFKGLNKHGECVIAIPDVSMAANVVKIGNASGRTVDKFAKFALTAAEARRVRPPLIRECFANLECKVIDTCLVKKYNLFVLEVVAAWIQPARKNSKMIHHHGHGAFSVDGKMIKFKSKMQ